MNGLEVDDVLWEQIEPLLPVPQRRDRSPGRRRLDDRKCLNGILFVLATGVRWNMLPQQLGYGSGMTCWRRLRDWQRAGVWRRLHQVLLHELGDRDAIDWSRACLDSSTVPAKRGASRPVRIRRIAANRARSAILFRMPGASRSR
jgi:transposase